MERKIESAYVYLDYRLLINDDFILRSDTNPRYSLRAYSRDLDISPTFLSEILRGKKDLSPQNSRSVFAKLGLTDQEIEYVLNLILSKNSKSEFERSNAEASVKSQYSGKEYIDNSSMDLIIRTIPHFIIYGLIRKISSKKSVVKFAESIGISAQTSEYIISEYINDKYIKSEDGQLKVIDENFAIKNHEKIIAASSNFNAFLHDCLQKEGVMEMPAKLCHSLILGFNEETFNLLSEAHKHFVKTAHRLGDQNQSSDRIVFISNVLYTQPILQ